MKQFYNLWASSIFTVCYKNKYKFIFWSISKLDRAVPVPVGLEVKTEQIIANNVLPPLQSGPVGVLPTVDKIPHNRIAGAS